MICIDFAFLLLRPLDLKDQIRKAWPEHDQHLLLHVLVCIIVYVQSCEI